MENQLFWAESIPAPSETIPITQGKHESRFSLFVDRSTILWQFLPLKFTTRTVLFTVMMNGKAMQTGGLKVKNTFIQVDHDDDDVPSAGVSLAKRQYSEPAPMGRQFSAFAKSDLTMTAVGEEAEALRASWAFFTAQVVLKAPHHFVIFPEF
eukprot:s402_g10.t1